MARILNFNDGFVSSEEPVKGSISPANKLTECASDADFVIYKGTAAAASDVYFNTTDSVIRLFNGTDWLSLPALTSDGNLVIENDLIVQGNFTVEGTTTTINTENLEVTDRNITVNKNGNDASAEGSGLTVDRDSTSGSIVFDSTKASKWKAGLAGSEVEIADVSSAQTFTGKTINAADNAITGLTNDSISALAAIEMSKLEALTAEKMVVTNPSGEISTISTTAIEAGYLSGVTSNIQTQLNDKQDSSTAATLTGSQTLTNKTINGSNNTLSNISLTASVTGTLPIANGGTNNGALAVTAGGVLYTDGTKVVNVGAGTSGQFLKSNAASAPSWSSISVTNSVASKTANYTITTSDYLVTGSASGGAFTLTLPSAVGIAGQIFVLKRTDQTLANIITIATTSSQTIDGSTTKTLATQYEQWTVQSDGANWQVLGHSYPQGWIAYTPTISNQTASNEGTYWRRNGDSIEIKSTWAISGVAGAAFDFSIPSGLTVDSSKMATTTNTNSHGHMYNTTQTSSGYAYTSVGPWPVFTDTSSSTTKLYTANANSGSRFAKMNGNTNFAASDRARLEAQGIPITNWNP